MLKNLFDIFLKATDPRPNYTGSRCLVEKNVVGGCDLCMQACPHDAVRIADRVEITESCTGCGLCVQACPSGALEYDVVGVLGVLKDQGVRVDTQEPPASRIACSKVPGDGFKLECLGRVSPAMVMASQAWGQELSLVRAECATCRLGGPSVPESLENVISIAREYRKNLSSEPLRVTVYEFKNGIESAPEEAEPAKTIPVAPKPAVSRRDALGSLFTTAKRGVSYAIPETPLPGIDASVPVKPVPDEWIWRKKTLRPRPADQDAQYWPAPSVNQDCIFCPVCQNVCPTSAITRNLESDGSFRITMQMDACTGCNACVVSCPPDAMKLEPETVFSRLSEVVLLREGHHLEGPQP